MKTEQCWESIRNKKVKFIIPSALSYPILFLNWEYSQRKLQCQFRNISYFIAIWLKPHWFNDSLINQWKMKRREKLGQQFASSVQARGKWVKRSVENMVFSYSVFSFSLLSLPSMPLQEEQLASVACCADGLRGAHIPRCVWHTSKVAGDWLCICQQPVIREARCSHGCLAAHRVQETEGIRKHHINVSQSTGHIRSHLVDTACSVSMSLIQTCQFPRSPKFSCLFLDVWNVHWNMLLCVHLVRNYAWPEQLAVYVGRSSKGLETEEFPIPWGRNWNTEK